MSQYTQNTKQNIIHKMNETNIEFINNNDIWMYQILSYALNKTTLVPIMLINKRFERMTKASDSYKLERLCWTLKNKDKLTQQLPSSFMSLPKDKLEQLSQLKLEPIHFRYVHLCTDDLYKDRFAELLNVTRWNKADLLSFDYNGHLAMTTWRNELLQLSRFFDPDTVIPLSDWLAIQDVAIKHFRHHEYSLVTVFASSLHLPFLEGHYLSQYRDLIFACMSYFDRVSLDEYHWYNQYEKLNMPVTREDLLQYPLFLSIAPDFVNDKKLVMKLIEKNWKVFGYVGDELREDPEFLLHCLAYAPPFEFKYFTNVQNTSLWRNPAFMEQAKLVSPYVAYAVLVDMLDLDDDESEGVINTMDRETILECLKHRALILASIPHEMQDEEIVLAAATMPERFYEDNLADHLKLNPNLILKLVQTVKGFTPKTSLISDRNLIIEILKVTGFELRNITIPVDKEIALVAVGSYGRAYTFLPDHLKADQDIIIQALSNNGEVIQYLPPLLKEDRQVVLMAVKSNGTALRFVPDSFRDDKEVVWNACKNSMAAFKYASLRLQSSDLDILDAASVVY
jgi:hypothetical protein